MLRFDYFNFTARLVLDFVANNERLCKLRIRGKFFKYSIINVHAPAEENLDEEKN